MANHNIKVGGGPAFVLEQHDTSEEEFNVTLTQEMAKRTQRLQDHSVDVAIRAKESREFLEWHINHLKSTWMDWLDQANKMFTDIKQTRAATEFESKALLAACGDVRKFFLSDEHEKEVAKLKEFVDVVERLRSLKQDGTLDAIADTILKLSK